MTEDAAPAVEKVAPAVPPPAQATSATTTPAGQATPVAPAAIPPAAKTSAEPNPYDLAEEGWRDLIAAAEKVQSAANKIKKTARSVDGYGIEKALIRHKPELMKKHLEGLREHRKENQL
jgi:hypothetical protein